MTVLSVVQQAATRIGVAVPSVLFSGTDRTSVELQEALNEAAKGIIDDFDWQRLKTVATVTGDGSETSFSLPADYRRMLKKARFWQSAMPNSPLVFIPDSDKWLELETQNVATIEPRATIYGGNLIIKPAIAAAATAKYFYISKYIFIANGDTAASKTDATADNDTFALDERLLKLGVIWRWKAAKGRPYAQDKDSYDALADSLAGSDKGSHLLHLGSRRIPNDVAVSYPWNIVP